MKQHRSTVLLFLSIFIYSCQTLSPITKGALPSSALKQFGDCWKQDGSVSFSAFKFKQPVLYGTLDWVREGKGPWRWEVYDPLGRTLLAGKVLDGKIQTESMDLSKLKIQKNGMLAYDGTSLALKWKEIHCFLNFRLPNEWLDLNLSSKTGSVIPQDLHVRFEESERTIEADFSLEKTCGSVRTSFMGVFSREKLTWCFIKEPKSAFLDFENVFRFEWTNGEEKEDEWKNYSK